MRTLLDQIESSLNSRLYFLSLFASLTVPDIGGALTSENGLATGARYVSWFDEWVRPQFGNNLLASTPAEFHEHIDLENPFDGAACYQFRCSLLHQGSTQHPKSRYERILFIEPGATPTTVHYCQFNDALCIDLPSFCTEVVQGGRAWLVACEQDPTVRRNMQRSAQRYPTGMAPIVFGVPIIT